MNVAGTEQRESQCGGGQSARSGSDGGSKWLVAGGTGLGGSREGRRTRRAARPVELGSINRRRTVARPPLPDSSASLLSSTVLFLRRRRQLGVALLHRPLQVGALVPQLGVLALQLTGERRRRGVVGTKAGGWVDTQASKQITSALA